MITSDISAGRLTRLMTPTDYRRLIVLLGIVLVTELVAIVYYARQIAEQDRKVFIANSEMYSFRSARDTACSFSDPMTAADWLGIIIRKPVGTNDLFDAMVREEKQRDIKDVIAHLRKKTGQDFGDNPTNWMDKFYWPRYRIRRVDESQFKRYPVVVHDIPTIARTRIPASGMNWKMEEFLHYSDDQPPDFADNFSLIQVGCGPGCVEYCLIDRTNGTVYPGTNFNQDFPHDYHGPEGFKFRRDSRLLIVYHATGSEYPVHVDFYVWQGTNMLLQATNEIRAAN